MAYVARVSNPNNQENPNYAKLLGYCIKHNHWSVFEQAFMTLELETTRGVAAQVLRHRSFTYQEFSQRYADSSMLADTIPMFDYQPPTGSRSDVRAKGTWKDNEWIVEFQRALQTGNNDDVQLNIKKTYLFGISRFEIAGRLPSPDIDEPLFGSGDVEQIITLSFEQ